MHHVRKNGDQVHIAEGEHGVQVHRTTRLGHLGSKDAAGRSAGEQRTGELAHRLRRRALAHAHEHDAAAERHHVATFQRRQPVIHIGVAPPLDNPASEVRVESVDGGGQQGFLATCRPVHRAQHRAVADPATGVAGEQGVGQRRQQELGRRRAACHQPRRLERQLAAHHAADQALRKQSRRQRLEPVAQCDHVLGVDEVGAELAVEDPVARHGLRNDGRQQLVHLEHRNTALDHRIDKRIVVVLGLRDPEHVVEQQVPAVGRRQAHLRQARPAHQHLAQAPDFRMHTECHGWLSRVGMNGLGAHKLSPPVASR